MSPIQKNYLFRLATIVPEPTSITRAFMGVQTSVMTAVESSLASSTSTEIPSSSVMTASSTGFLSTAKNTRAPSLPINATLFGAAPRSGKNLRVSVFAIILLSILAIVLLTATIYLVRLRTRGMRRKHNQIDFERRMEVIEARAIMPIDETLTRTYSNIPLFGGEDNASEGKELTILTRVYSNEDLNAHPLFHAELKKSRTLSYDRRNPRTPATTSTSYNTMCSRVPRIELPISPTSPHSLPMSRALSQYTTMQTRRPRTPSVDVVLPEIQSELAAIYENPVFESLLFAPTASVAPSSIYSEVPAQSGRLSLTPMPARTIDILPVPIESDGSNRKWPIAISELLVQPLNPPISSTKQQRTSPNLFAADFSLYTGMDFNIAPLVPSQQVSYSPVHSFLTSPVSPQRAFHPPTRRPSLAELNAMSEDMSLDCPLGLERVNGEVKIERWLEGNVATLTSLAYQATPENGLSKGRRLSFVERGRQGRRRSVKLSPIRGMQPSWARRGSAPQGEADV